MSNPIPSFSAHMSKDDIEAALDAAGYILTDIQNGEVIACTLGYEGYAATGLGPSLWEAANDAVDELQTRMRLDF